MGVLLSLSLKGWIRLDKASHSEFFGVGPAFVPVAS